jgi:glycosyltransferase involved in cell wall biosynthesis
MKRIKIIHINLSSGFAGAERHMIDLINYQSKKNQTYLIKTKKNSFINHSVVTKKTKIYETPVFFKKIFLKIFIQKINPDIIHTHLGDASRVISKNWGNFKLVATCHMNYKKKHYINHDGIIALNKTQEKNIKKTFYKKILRIPLWAPAIKSKKQSKIYLLNKLNIQNNSYIFGSIGRFHYQKGFDLILKIFNKLQLKNCYLILIGNNHLNFKKIYKNNNNIKILGHKNNPDDYLKIFNTFVFPSRWESFGLSLLEAMRKNLPIITSVNEGNKDWIKKYNVTLFNVNNEVQLTKSLLKHYLTKPKRQRYNLDYFRPNIIIQKINNFYKSI